MRSRFLPTALVVCLFVCGCGPAAETCADGPCWLTLQSWVGVGDDGTVDGFLRWIYVSEDPAGEEPPASPDCEVWERLELATVAVDPACRSCTHQFEGTASIDADDSTCADAAWEPWQFTYAFGPIEGDADLQSWAERGFTHHVQTRWSPDLGDTQGFQSLFVAQPESWDGGSPGASGDPSGEYALEALHFWDLR